jgi:peptidyl-prolyl cis-trans isomerase B (cyclophilin B)
MTKTVKFSRVPLKGSRIVLAALLFGFAVAFTTNSIHATTHMDPVASSYQPPISGANVDKYTAHPKRRLVIVTKQGTIKVQLFEKIAPNHVAQIMQLAKTHVYDGTTFHRTIPGFMIQGGDPNSKDDDLSNDGSGGSGAPLKAEFNEVHHARGICSMARTNDPNSATSQFFIMNGDNGGLDHQYTVWGQVTDGMDVVDKITALPHIQDTNPGKAAQIIKMTIEG